MNAIELGINIIDVAQRTEDWFDIRCGMVTASRVADVMAKLKPTKKQKELKQEPSPAKAREDYMIELATERITKKPMEHFVSAWMERGHKLEPNARFRYEELTGEEVELIGFICHPTIKDFGASPDGGIIAGKRKLVEFKCPAAHTHLRYVLGDVPPREYRYQQMAQLACCGDVILENDFVSYCPEFDEPLDIFVRTLKRNEQEIAAIDAGVFKFLAEVEAMVRKAQSGSELIADKLRQSLRLVKNGRWTGSQPIVDALDGLGIGPEDCA